MKNSVISHPMKFLQMFIKTAKWNSVLNVTIIKSYTFQLVSH